MTRILANKTCLGPFSKLLHAQTRAVTSVRYLENILSTRCGCATTEHPKELLRRPLGPSASISCTARGQARWNSSIAAAGQRSNPPDSTIHIAYVALGSNLGDRQWYIQRALNALDSRGIQVINTSQLYESDPMYVTDQPQFLNAACCVMTTLDPHSLMRACQQIETELGRVKLVNKGARCIDLDVLLYDSAEIHTSDLTIPHIGIKERDFVYVPLAE